MYTHVYMYSVYITHLFLLVILIIFVKLTKNIFEIHIQIKQYIRTKKYK